MDASTSQGKIAVLFARKDSVYKTIPECDVYDQERDALTWLGGVPAICHPPCRLWGRLRQFSTAPIEEKQLAIFAVDQVRKHGGILEHPSGSSLWDACNLPHTEKERTSLTDGHWQCLNSTGGTRQISQHGSILLELIRRIFRKYLLYWVRLNIQSAIPVPALNDPSQKYQRPKGSTRQ